ncbi:unnamed protein product [Ambrosiozyma monospora]|uniref:Unnamed protein product n=1 Tax=Ambrosiozyma monospora TaxID=43982 RepID=A0A9W6Z708_AMBMO|nr:unnamed protein product [Ambrosiozyma monospora]
MHKMKQEDDDSEDETLLALTTQKEVFVTHNQGSSWEEVSPDREFTGIYPNKFYPDEVYLLSTHDRVVYSRNRGKDWKSFRTPAEAITGVTPLYFHPQRPNFLIFVGQEGCDDAYSNECHTVAYSSQSYGARWKKLQENVKYCQFTGSLHESSYSKLIICEKLANEATNYRSNLIASTDFFDEDVRWLFEDVIGMVKFGDLLVVAAALDGDASIIQVSLDGFNWSDAFFPSNFPVNKKSALTVLSAATKSMFLYVITESAEFGSLLKPNSVGQYYVLSLDYVNRDSRGFVDFEQMPGLEGVIMVNTVTNPQDVRTGSRKKLKSMITYNDGAHWSYIQPPLSDLNGDTYECFGQSLELCSLNLHGYTEREDERDTSFSSSAVGMMIGIGK